MKQIADFLKNFREKKGLTEQEIVDKTTLTPVVIRLIESGDFKSIGAEFYIKSFLGQYCKVIGLTDSETDEIIKQVIKGISNKHPAEEKGVKKSSGLLLWFFSGLLILLVFFFFMLKGEKVENNSPKNKHIPAVAKEGQNIGLSMVSPEKEKKKFKQEPEQCLEPDSHGGKPVETLEVESQTGNLSRKNQGMEEKENVKSDLKNNAVAGKSKETAVLNNKKVKVRFEAKCMCWVNIAFNNRVIKDFILKENEKLTLAVPKGAVLTIGNAGCVTVYFNDRVVKLKGEKVVRNLTVE